MKVKIPTNSRLIFRQRLELLKSFPPYNKLMGRELDLLAELQYHYYINKDVELEKRHKIVFDYDTYQKIMESLKISEASLNNNKMFLRKKGFIESKSMKSFLLVDIDDPTVLLLELEFIVK